MVLFGVNVNVTVPKEVWDRLSEQIRLMDRVKEQALTTGILIGVVGTILLFFLVSLARGNNRP